MATRATIAKLAPLKAIPPSEWKDVTLSRGNHSNCGDGTCLMEAVCCVVGPNAYPNPSKRGKSKWIDAFGRPLSPKDATNRRTGFMMEKDETEWDCFSDTPYSVDEVVALVGQQLNDAEFWESDAERTATLLPLIPAILKADGPPAPRSEERLILGCMRQLVLLYLGILKSQSPHARKAIQHTIEVISRLPLRVDDWFASIGKLHHNSTLRDRDCQFLSELTGALEVDETDAAQAMEQFGTSLYRRMHPHLREEKHRSKIRRQVRDLLVGLYTDYLKRCR